ncbi:MAG: HEAT repeat domain-containing protein [Armatimonadota bacterium]
MDEKTRRQITWIVLIGALACLIVWGVGRSQEIGRLQNKLSSGTPEEQIQATRELVDARTLSEALQDQPRWVQQKAVSSIAYLGTSQAWYQLLTAWYLLDAPVQEQASSLLTTMGNSAIPTLIEALKAKDANTRKGVAPILINIGEPVIPYVLPLMDAWDDYIRTGAAVVLGGLGELASDPVIAVIKRGGPDAASGQTDEEYLRERETAQDALRRMKATAFEPIADQLLTDADSADVRGIGATLLGAIADQTVATSIAPEDALKALPPLVDRLQNDPAWSVRRKAAVSVGLLGPVARGEGAVSPVIQTLQDPSEHPEVRSACAEALGRFGDPSAAGPLVNVMMNSYQGLEEQIVLALIRLGKSSVAPLAQAVRSGDPQVRLMAVQALAGIPGPEAIEPLTVALQMRAGEGTGEQETGATTAADVRRAAAEALGNRSEQALTQRADVAVEPLVNALYAEDWHVYYAARDALGKCGDAAIQPLLGAMDSSDVRAAHMAQQALVDIGPDAVPALVDALLAADTKPRLANWASVALGELGYDAIEPVADVATDTSRSTAVRVAAIQALGETRSADAIDAVNDAYQSGNRALKIAAMNAIQTIGMEGGTPTLMDGLQATSDRVADRAMQILLRWPHVDLDNVKELLDAERQDLQYRAAVVLAFQETAATSMALAAAGAAPEAQGTTTQLDTLGKLLSDAATKKSASTPLRLHAIEGLSNIVYEPGLSELGEIVRSGGEFVSPAAKAIAHIGVKTSRMEAQGTLVEISEAGKLLIDILIETDSPELRMEAAVALSLMQEGPVNELISHLETASDDLKPWIAATLGAIGKYATENVANTHSGSQDDEFRHWLGVALACIGDSRALHVIKFMPKEERPTGPDVERAQELTSQIRLRKK